MGSPITFSGFNNIDFGGVLNAIMQQERAPITAIEAQRTSLQAQNSAFSTLATRLGALRTAVTALAEGDGLSKVSATTSDANAVGISTGSASVTGRYDLVISNLARAQVTRSETTYASVDTVVATSGAISLARFNQPPIDILVDPSMTLQDVADAINGHPDSPVNASIVQVSPGQYRLVLTGRATGASNGFTVDTSSLAGGSGLAFPDTDGDGTSGDTAADNVQVANDAALTVNGVGITSASNVITDAVPGVTVTLLKKDPTATVSIEVAKDQSAATAKVEEFATAYNALVSFINDQNTAVANGKPGIGRDPVVRGLRDALRNALLAPAASGALTRLAEAGVEFDTTGKMRVNTKVLTAALDASSTDVAALFADRFGAIKTLISSYTDAGGLVADVRQRIGTQVSRLGARIDVLEAQLALRRAALQREFIAADRAMSQLNNQGSSLTQLTGQYRLF